MVTKNPLYNGIFWIVLIVLFLSCVILIWINDITGFYSCRQTHFDKDKYCIKESVMQGDCSTNITGSWCTSQTKWNVKSYAQDQIDAEDAARKAKGIKDYNQKVQDCFDEGRWYNYSFDIFNDYNLSCAKIAYINDHLIDQSQQMDGGYISGQYSGFFSYGEVEGHLYYWVTEGVLATGQLVKNISYHLDCYNSTLTPAYYSETKPCWFYPDGSSHCEEDGSETKQITYYSKSDFVIEYVRRCVK